MDWHQIQDVLARMQPAEQQAWLLKVAGLVALMATLLWLESRFFRSSGRVGSWLAVRLVSAIAAPLTLAAVLLPSRAVGGPEALAVFYLTLFTLAPLIWFGSHALAGRLVRPALSRAECILMGFSGLAILAIPATAFMAAESALFAAAREIGQRREVPADNPPLEHTVQAVQTYQLPGVGLIHTQTLQGKPDIRLLRVEQRQGGQWPTERNVAHATYCTQGNDVHLMWSAQEAPPYLRLHWAQSNGAATKAEFTPDMSAARLGAAVDFTIGFRSDGVDPIAPVPRERAYLILEQPGLTPYTQMLSSPPEAGEVRTSDCVMPGFKRWAATPGWRVKAIGLVFYLPTGGTGLRTLIERPD